MDTGSFVTLLAAGIAAIVAALTFVAGEVLKIRQTYLDRQLAVIDDVVKAFSVIPYDEMRPKLFRLWSTKPLAIPMTITRLIPVLRKRDLILVDWLIQKCLQTVNATERDERVIRAAEATSGISVWLRNRRTARKLFSKELDDLGIEMRLVGSRRRAKADAREPLHEELAAPL